MNNSGRVRIVVHLKSGENVHEGMCGADFVQRYMLREQFTSEWGTASIASATLASLKVILMKVCPGAKHVLVASGTCIPVKALPPRQGEVSFGAMLGLGCMNSPGTEGRKVVHNVLTETGMSDDQANAWANAFTGHHQFVMLPRKLVLELVVHEDEIVRFTRVSEPVLPKVWCPETCAPDEVFIATALRKYGLLYSTDVECLPACLAFFKQDAKHAVSFTDLSTKHSVYEASKPMGKVSLSDILHEVEGCSAWEARPWMIRKVHLDNMRSSSAVMKRLKVLWDYNEEGESDGGRER